MIIGKREMHKGKKNMIDFWFVWIEKKVKLERNNIGVVWFCEDVLSFKELC